MQNVLEIKQKYGIICMPVVWMPPSSRQRAFCFGGWQDQLIHSDGGSLDLREDLDLDYIPA